MADIIRLRRCPKALIATFNRADRVYEEFTRARLQLCRDANVQHESRGTPQPISLESVQAILAEALRTSDWSKAKRAIDALKRRGQIQIVQRTKTG